MAFGLDLEMAISGADDGLHGDVLATFGSLFHSKIKLISCHSIEHAFELVKQVVVVEDKNTCKDDFDARRCGLETA